MISESTSCHLAVHPIGSRVSPVIILSRTWEVNCSASRLFFRIVRACLNQGSGT